MSRVVLKPHHPPTKKKKHGKFFRGLFVSLGAMLLTTLVIRANDVMNFPVSSLMGGVGASVQVAKCPPDMAYVSASGGGFCIDRYEASTGKTCPHANPLNQFETTENLSQSSCIPLSVQGASPWVNIPVAQARELCLRAGKHLATNAEWYRAALSTPDDARTDNPDCVINSIGASQAEKTGAHSACVSSSGAYDMVGNVWEWVDANTINGTYEGRDLPSEGYVTDVDANGVPIATSHTPSDQFHDDYFYVSNSGVNGMFRGGFWSLKEKAGVAAINAAITPSFVGVAVGFRCAR